MLTTVTILITDVRMSGIDGIELQRRVRLDRPDLPIIFISAHVDDQVQRRALDGGAVRFFHKPFDIVELLLEIDRAFQSQQADKHRIDEGGRRAAPESVDDLGFGVEMNSSFKRHKKENQ